MKQSNYEKAKEEEIGQLVQMFILMGQVKIFDHNEDDFVRVTKEEFEQLLSSFAEKIKEGVETDMGEKYVLRSRESSDSQTIKE